MPLSESLALVFAATILLSGEALSIASPHQAAWATKAFQPVKDSPLTLAGSQKPLSASGVLTFPPVDEAASDPSFLLFRDELLRLIRARDVEAVAAIAHPDIKLSFGGSFGRETFREWLMENHSFGGLSYWQELEQTLLLGGVFEGPDAFCTPYVFCLDIPGCETCDPYETLVAVRKEAPVYSAPSADSEVLAALSYGVVEVVDTKNYPWSRVRVPVGQTSASEKMIEGYVRGPDFRSPIDYRSFFEKQADGSWLMTVFIAGD